MEEIEEEEGAAVPRRRRRSSNASSSPDFEFWMVGNPSSFPPPQLLSADELFSDGVLLPLHLLHPLHPNPNPNPNPNPPNPPELQPQPQPQPQPEKLGADIAAPPSSGSKRWRDIFRVAGEKRGEEKERRRDRKSGAAASAAAAAAEIGINIWPFARSRSAGNARGAGAGAGSGSGSGSGSAAGRKASSAPCSRSNSRGESAAARRWAASPGRAGVHVGRSSPVWQMRRTRGPDKAHAANAAHAAPRDKDKDKDKDKATGCRRSGGSGARVLSLNVNTCIGYRSHVTCRGDSADKKTADEVSASAAAGGVSSNGSLFILRNLFSSKKVY